LTAPPLEGPDQGFTELSSSSESMVRSDPVASASLVFRAAAIVRRNLARCEKRQY